jgi:pimeloyl-ACP methyl ester carboxylesterase
VSDVRHRRLRANGIELHLAEAGEGPLVLLCHGFPECWYSWRHQLPALAAAGYHAVAPDMRGYGQSEAPAAIESYTLLHLVGDLVGLCDALGAQDAVVVGHDWGAIVAWAAPLLRPDRFRAVVGMSVPFVPRLPVRPTQAMAAAAGDRFMYILYFQEPGKAEAELEADVRRTLRMMLYSASGSIPEEHVWRLDLPKTAGFLDGLTDPEKLPGWLRPEDLDTYTAEFERTGFRGGLNWYRNFDRNWELMGAWAGAKLQVPAFFLGGERDLVLAGPDGKGNPLLAVMDSFVPHLRGKRMIEGAGHWTQQEAPEEVNAALLEFLRGLD